MIIWYVMSNIIKIILISWHQCRILINITLFLLISDALAGISWLPMNNLIDILYFMSLSQDTATFRASVIRKDSITYNFNIIFSPKSYYGLAEISFYLENVNFTSLEIDFSGSLLEDVIINSRRFMPKHIDNFLIIPKEYLQKGRNRASIMYIN